MSEDDRDMKFVVRDFPKILEFVGLFAVCTGLLIAVPTSYLESGNIDEAVPAVLFLSAVEIVLATALRLSVGGIEVTNDKVSYYMSATGVPLFRRNIDTDNIVDLSSEIQHIEAPNGPRFKTYHTNISSGDSRSKLSWNNRGARDRFLSIMKHMYPHITVHRSS